MAFNQALVFLIESEQTEWRRETPPRTGGEISDVRSVLTWPLTVWETMSVEVRAPASVWTQITHSSPSCIVGAHSLMPTCYNYKIQQTPVSMRPDSSHLTETGCQATVSVTLPPPQASSAHMPLLPVTSLTSQQIKIMMRRNVLGWRGERVSYICANKWM